MLDTYAPLRIMYLMIILVFVEAMHAITLPKYISAFLFMQENDVRKQLEKKRSEARTKALEKARLKKQAAAMDLDDQEEGVDFGEPFMGEEEEEDDSYIINSLLAEMKAGIFQRRKN